jgi:uncharacterized protein (DUF1330 family)
MAAYLLAICDVTNPNENFKKYIGRSSEMIARHGGEYILRGKTEHNLKGELLEGKVVILTQWPSMDTLNAFLSDPEYVNDVAPLRDGTGEYHFAAYE